LGYFGEGDSHDDQLFLLGVWGARLSACLLTKKALTIDNCCSSEMALRANIMTSTSCFVFRLFEDAGCVLFPCGNNSR
jgi:hypothetical protein